jgi:hypothetical protein
LRVELNGGIYEGRKQKAVVDFICDEELTGDEGNLDPEDKYQSKMRQLVSRDDAGTNGTSSSLRWESYAADPANDQVDLLRLQWKTKYACKDQRDVGNGETKGWGFFTWFILM